jgi:hypothetical protein
MTLTPKRRKGLAATFLLLLGAAPFLSCTDVTSPDRRIAPPPARQAFSMTSCGASYNVVTYETDDLMAQYGLPPTQDTLAVCETWTGSDYATEALVTGSSENALMVPDTVQGVRYASGSLTGTASNGGAVGAAMSVGSSLFEFMYADASQQQASADNPYYGVYAPGCGGLDDCTAALSSSATSSARLSVAPTSGNPALAVSSAAMTAAANPDTTRYNTHHVHRTGVRALIDDKQEIGRSAKGERRFRGVKNGVETILSIDPALELLTGEETRSADGRLHRAQHEWKRGRSGYMRVKTETDDEEVVRGHRYLSHSTLTVRDLRINDVVVDATPGAKP